MVGLVWVVITVYGSLRPCLLGGVASTGAVLDHDPSKMPLYLLPALYRLPWMMHGVHLKHHGGPPRDVLCVLL
jgi:hypothetical protein